MSQDRKEGPVKSPSWKSRDNKVAKHSQKKMFSKVEVPPKDLAKTKKPVKTG